MSIDRRLAKMEDAREAELGDLTKRFVDWIELQPKPVQYSIWRFVPIEGCEEAGIEESTIRWATCGRPEPNDDDRTLAAAAFEKFPPDLLSEMEQAQPGSTAEMEQWFLGA